jgi:HD-GYP domain-containing protein (c-di-GMP phosphodiesterase class II)
MGRVSDVDRALALSGGAGRAASSARAGFLPLPLRRVPSSALRHIPVYLRTTGDKAQAGTRSEFVLYRGLAITFTDRDRERLLDNGRQLVYIRIADQARFQRQAELALTETAADPARESAERSAIVYETSLALMNEVLTDPDLPKHAPRIEEVSRAVTTLVLNDAQAFQHLLASAQHDFYTATHMVNVATWMVLLSHALGYQKRDELCRICQAGLLHDLGKVHVPGHVLNKRAPLTEDEWALIRQHPLLGETQIAALAGGAGLAPIVARQHHERLDGGGYPDGLSGGAIHAVSRICAVVDSFDAMTALRPFKQQTMTISDAIIAIQARTPAQYDANVVQAWLALLRRVDDCIVQHPTAPGPLPAAPLAHERRQNKRFDCNFAARIHVLRRTRRGWSERKGTDTLVHSVSRFGLGLLSPAHVSPGERLRVYYRGNNGPPRVLHGECVRCRGYEDGRFEIGFELDQST